MIDLITFVIPKIMNEWEYIAYALRYDLAVIKTIKEKGHGDPPKCCRELFIDWLTTKHGARAGRKVWSTLISALKKVEDIAEDIIEGIITEVNKLEETYIPIAADNA